jgi:hypothetical protein
VDPKIPDHLEQMRGYLTDETVDESSYLTPKKQSELVALSDEEVLRLYRKIAFANKHPWTVVFEHEMRGRLIQALAALRESSEKASKRLEGLTWALVGLTVVIAIFTVALFLEG